MSHVSVRCKTAVTSAKLVTIDRDACKCKLFMLSMWDAQRSVRPNRPLTNSTFVRTKFSPTWVGVTKVQARLSIHTIDSSRSLVSKQFRTLTIQPLPKHRRTVRGFSDRTGQRVTAIIVNLTCGFLNHEVTIQLPKRESMLVLKKLQVRRFSPSDSAFFFSEKKIFTSPPHVYFGQKCDVDFIKSLKFAVNCCCFLILMLWLPPLLLLFCVSFQKKNKNFQANNILFFSRPSHENRTLKTRDQIPQNKHSFLYEHHS